MLAFFIAALRADNPMAKLSKKSRHPEAPAPAVEPAPRVAPRREAADQRLRRFRFFSCFRVSPKPLDKFLAETAKRRRPEMAPQRLEKIESAPGNGMVSEASKPQDLVHGRTADRALRPRAARTLTNSTRGPEGNFPPRKPLKSLETGKNSRSLAARADPSSGRASRVHLPPRGGKGGSGRPVNTRPPTGSTCPRASGRRRR